MEIQLTTAVEAVRSRRYGPWPQWHAGQAVIRWATAIAAVTAVGSSAALSFGTATADGKILLGGGAGITVSGGEPCTLTAIGHDNSGELIGFTSAHCGGVGGQVTAGSGPVVGDVVSTDDALDYAVIKFDSAQVNPMPEFDGFPINGIGPDPGYGEQACQQSSTNGNNCFPIRVPGPAPDTISGHARWQPGNDGAPVTVDGLLVGMTRGTYWLLPGIVHQRRPEIVPINAILADLNDRGGPGAGFVLVGH